MVGSESDAGEQTVVGDGEPVTPQDRRQPEEHQTDGQQHRDVRLRTCGEQMLLGASGLGQATGNQAARHEVVHRPHDEMNAEGRDDACDDQCHPQRHQVPVPRVVEDVERDVLVEVRITSPERRRIPPCQHGRGLGDGRRSNDQCQCPGADADDRAVMFLEVGTVLPGELGVRLGHGAGTQFHGQHHVAGSGGPHESSDGEEQSGSGEQSGEVDPLEMQ